MRRKGAAAQGKKTQASGTSGELQHECALRKTRIPKRKGTQGQSSARRGLACPRSKPRLMLIQGKRGCQQKEGEGPHLEKERTKSIQTNPSLWLPLQTEISEENKNPLGKAPSTFRGGQLQTPASPSPPGIGRWEGGGGGGAVFCFALRWGFTLCRKHRLSRARGARVFHSFSEKVLLSSYRRMLRCPSGRRLMTKISKTGYIIFGPTPPPKAHTPPNRGGSNSRLLETTLS